MSANEHHNLRLDGQRLRRWRRAAGVKRTELGKRLGYSCRTVKAWERGERRMPAREVGNLLDALAAMRAERTVSLDELYAEMGNWDDLPAWLPPPPDEYDDDDVA